MSEYSVCLRSYFHTMTAKLAFPFGSLDLDIETQVCSFYQIEINMSPK